MSGYIKTSSGLSEISMASTSMKVVAQADGQDVLVSSLCLSENFQYLVVPSGGYGAFYYSTSSSASTEAQSLMRGVLSGTSLVVFTGSAWITVVRLKNAKVLRIGT